jgi:hypothetical protein
MIRAVLTTVILMAAMLGPYLPGRFDASAATLSFVIQVASYVSLLFVPVGIAWMVIRKRSSLWHRVTVGLAGLIVFVAVVSAVSVNHLSLGTIIGFASIMYLQAAFRRTEASMECTETTRPAIAPYIAIVPVVLVAFITLVLPRAAEWSRDRAIRSSAALIAEIASYHQRRGHYPLSLQSLNRDFPTGVVGIERFHYEPNGQSFNLFFVRQHIALDAKEVVMFNPRDEHRFASHELDILQYDGEELDQRRGDRRRTRLTNPRWISILFD